MDPAVLHQILVGLISIMFFHTVYSHKETCNVDIHGCGYEVSISPMNNNCKRETIVESRREKRSMSEGDESDAVTKADWTKMNKMVERALEKMSTRVLRWWRKMDRKIEQLASNRGTRSRSAALNTHCPDGFIGVDNWPSCYLMSNFNTSWYEAKEFCTAFDSDLVAMGTVREHFILTFLIKNNPAISEADGWWTSGSFIGNTKQWMWTSQFFTKPFTFIKWSEGEPNEVGSQCMLLKRIYNHQWNDDICTEPYNFICEVNIQLT